MFLAIYLKISGTYQLSVISYQLSVISYQLSVISYQLSVISYQLSVISYQLSVIRSQLSGVRSQESGVRSQESGVRSQESGDCFYLFSYLPRKEAKLTLTKRLYEQGYQREDILRIENGFLEETRFLDRLVK